MRVLVLIMITLCVVCPCGTGRAAEIELVAVGDPGNPVDTEGERSLGSVARGYEIGRYEISNAQYAEFLNAVAQLGDPSGLWNSGMGDTPEGGIRRLGSGDVGDPYEYQTISSMDDKPVNYVSWEDAARFVNWLQNGKSQGAACDSCTEFGSYDLGPGSDRTRSEEAVWALPSEDEWYKAAFYDADDGDGDPGYWLYPTRSDAEPSMTACTANGDGTTGLLNAANYSFGCQWNSVVGNVASAGTSGRGSSYGTFDQAGNVEELLENETARGGDFFNGSERLLSTSLPFLPPGEEKGVGFRVVYGVPEPSAIALQVCAVAWIALLVRLRSSRPLKSPRRASCAPVSDNRARGQGAEALPRSSPAAETI